MRFRCVMAITLAVMLLGAARPGFEHLRVGPLVIGESSSDVERLLGGVIRGGSICYTDADSVVLLWFDHDLGLYRIAIASPPPRDCTVRVPKRYMPIRDWKWAGGTVSTPINAVRLASQKVWVAPGQEDSFWHFRTARCGGSIFAQPGTARYWFVLGPVGCW